MPRLDVRPEAELDALEAASWYDSERRGLGLEFLSELRATFARIEEQGRRVPDGPALALLRVAAKNPIAVAEALHGWRGAA